MKRLIANWLVAWPVIYVCSDITKLDWWLEFVISLPIAVLYVLAVWKLYYLDCKSLFFGEED